jgi:nitrous oxidase accessory protein NosD
MERGLIRPISRPLALAALVVVGLVVGPTALASTGPMSLASDTTLTEDHHGSIFIVADGVTLNCAGHAVIGEGAGDGISVDANNVTVRKCDVTSFATGIYTAARGGRILANTLNNNGEGLRLDGATGAAVSGNSANANDFWGIIACCGASNNAITSNTTKANRLIGVALNNASSNRVTSNFASANGSGFDVSFSSNFNTISWNVAANSASTGFGFQMANSNTINGNVAIHNGEGAEGGGFAFNDSSRNTVTNNSAILNGSSGFNVFFESELNLFTRNFACLNFFGDAFDSSTGAGNTWINNFFCKSALP